MLLPKTLLIICSVWLLYSSQSANALIVPQELPSILSLVYSNIPPIKKGTDSRLGFGFRLGEHADFQVMLELGPQKNTRPVGDQDSDNSFNKRQINKAEQIAVLRQQLRQQLQQRQQQELTSTERSAANWLENWSQDMNALKKTNTKSKPKQHTAVKQQTSKTNLMPVTPLMPAQALQQLQLLYKMATTTTTIVPPIDSALPVKEFSTLDPLSLAERLKSKKQITKELMDVRLDDEQ